MPKPSTGIPRSQLVLANENDRNVMIDPDGRRVVKETDRFVSLSVAFSQINFVSRIDFLTS